MRNRHPTSVYADGLLRGLVVALLVGGISGTSFAADAPSIRVASKNFNESYLLGEIAAQVLEEAGFDVERRFGLGGTLICFEALVNDEIDLYVEYTGTLSQAILSAPEITTLVEIDAAIALSKTRNAGHVYVTEDVLPNPYDTLPIHWIPQLDALTIYCP